MRTSGMDCDTSMPTRASGLQWLASGIVAAAAVLALAGCSPAHLLNSVVPSDGYTVRTDIAYGAQPRQRLDVYSPNGASSATHPVLIFFYGGSWKSGDRDLYRFIGEAFTRLGYVVVVPDYRLYPDVRFPAFVEDAARVVGWVYEHEPEFGGDPDRLILAGHSAGAHIAMLVLFDPRYLAAEDVPVSAIRGGVGLAGPYALDPLKYASIRPVFADLDDPDAARPVAFASADAPPLLLLHGTSDRTVGLQNTRQMAEAVQNAGGHVTVRQYDGLGHIGIIASVAAPFRGRDAVYDDLAAFLATVTADAASAAARR